jgi:hypothetical protein
MTRSEWTREKARSLAVQTFEGAVVESGETQE